MSPTLRAQSLVQITAMCLAPSPVMWMSVSSHAWLLLSSLAGPGGARTSVHPPEAILPRGGSIQVNCSASCATPLMLGLETQLPKVEVDSGDNWKLFELSDIQEDSSPICFSDCGHDQETALATITVYCEWQGWGEEGRDQGQVRKSPCHLEAPLWA